MSRLRVWSMTFAGLAMVAITGCVTPTWVTLHPTSAMVRIGGVDGAKVPREAGSYRLQMVRNEREGFQFAVLPKGNQSKRFYPFHVRIHADNPGAPAATLYQVLPVEHVAPPTTEQFIVPPRRLGQIPDVLMPVSGHRDGKKTVKVESGKAPLTYYLEFHSTRQTRPGKYIYHVGVLAGKTVDKWLHVQVTVADPVLPDRLPFRTATMWNWSLEDYCGRPLTFEEKQVFWDFFLDQRLSPNDFFGKTANPSPTDAQQAGLKDRGLSVMNLTFVGGKRPRPLSEEYKAKIAPQLKAWREQLQALGMEHDAVILLADEPVAGTAEVCRQNAKWFKEQFPEVKIWVATRPAPEWDFAGIFDPVMAHSTDFYKPHSHTDEAFVWWRQQDTGGQAASGTQSKTRAGHEYWWFHSVEPYAPYTNLRLDNLPIEARVAGWQSALYGVDGYEYFWMTDWSNNKDTREMAWPDRAAVWKTGMSGAGTLCYPDEKMRPMPSLRLVNLRDGLEDWALIEMLAARTDAAARREAVGDVTTDLAHYTTDPQVILKARKKVIERLR